MKSKSTSGLDGGTFNINHKTHNYDIAITLKAYIFRGFFSNIFSFQDEKSKQPKGRMNSHAFLEKLTMSNSIRNEVQSSKL